jgi:hypothetical protein
MSRWVARLLALLVLVPCGVAGTRRAVHAQEAAPLVYILDFNNQSEIGGALLGRQAAAAMSVELAESGTWNVVPDRQVQQAAQTLGLRPPFDRVARQLIARAVFAPLVMYGAVEAAGVQTNPMEAKVRIRVFVEDTRTGSLYNGAMVDGASVPRMGFRGEADILLEEALAKAAFKAREVLAHFKPPEGTVLNTAVVGETRTKAMINVGSRQGVRRDMEMVVTRRGDLVGFVKVLSIQANDAMTSVTINLQGVRPEDHVRAVFSFAAFPSSITRLERQGADARTSRPTRLAHSGKNKNRKPAQLALNLAADRGGEFQPMVAAEQEKGEPLVGANGERGGVEAEKVTVEEPRARRLSHHNMLSGPVVKILAGGALLAGILMVAGNTSFGGGGGETRAFDVRNELVQVGGCGGPTALRVRWDRPKGVPPGGTVTPGGANFRNGILGYVVWRTDTTGQGTPEVVGGVMGDMREFLDESQVPHTVPNVLSAPGPWQVGAAPTGPADLPGVAGLLPGHRYRYQSLAAYHTEQDFNGDGTPDPQDLFAPFSPYSNPATFIVPELLIFPAAGSPADLTNLTVRWQTTDGADRYQVIISRDIRFLPNQTVRLPVVTVVPPDRGGPLEAEVTGVNVAGDAKLKGATQVFISVVAFNSGDPVKVKPNGGVCYAPIQVVPIAPPPPTP